MHLLILITRYPYPANSGDLIYNAGLIDMLELDPNITISVHCGEIQPIDAPKPSGHSIWFFGEAKSRVNDFSSLFSIDPRTAHRCHTEIDIQNITALISKNRYDYVLISEASAGRGINRYRTAAPNTTRFVYIAHNIDTKVRVEAAREIGSPIMRPFVLLDGKKGAKLEQRVLNASDCMTAISPEDLLGFDQLIPNLPKLVLKPGYSGARRNERIIDTYSTRCAVLVGSFDWYVKKINLLELVKAHAIALNDGKVDFKLRIAGRMPPKLFKELSSQYPHLDLRPSFDQIESVINDSRVALVLDRLGSGFKLKILDYIFARVPIVAYPHSMAGSELRSGIDYCGFDTVEDAIVGIQSLIDNFSILNQFQNAAFQRASDVFDWDTRRCAFLSFLKKT